MQRLMSVLKVLLIISIAILLIAVAANLLLGMNPSGLIWPLLSGLFAYGFLSGSNFGAAPQCPTCGTQQPLWRKPTSFRQMMWGGWTCANCGTEMDRHGRAIERQA